jgi:hypothetical protein
MTDSDNTRLLTALDANWQAEMEGPVKPNGRAGSPLLLLLGWN